eukprot:m.165502 g.165502  ORF g.165502 m.165502 type:complete len:61 (-) comp16425_c0_seq4:3821-4003(-)
MTKEQDKFPLSVKTNNIVAKLAQLFKFKGFCQVKCTSMKGQIIAADVQRFKIHLQSSMGI